MTDEEWGEGWVRCLGVLLNGETVDHVDQDGQQMLDDSFLVLLNCHHDQIDFFLPEPPSDQSWELVLHTADETVQLPKPWETGQPVPPIRQTLAVIRSVPTKAK